MEVDISRGKRQGFGDSGRLEGDVIGKGCAGNTSAARSDLVGAGPGLVTANWLRAVSRVEESSSE